MCFMIYYKFLVVDEFLHLSTRTTINQLNDIRFIKLDSSVCPVMIVDSRDAGRVSVNVKK